MARYNLVLLPDEGDIQKIAHWHNLFASVTDGYSADGQLGMPHVTLCQFSMNGGDHHIRDHDVDPNTQLTLVLGETKRRPGEGDHAGHDWIEIIVKPSEALSTLQVKVWAALQALGAQMHTGLGEGYHPHVTLARVPKGADLPELPQDTDGVEMPMRPALFLCSSNGECLRQVDL